MSKQMQIPF